MIPLSFSQQAHHATARMTERSPTLFRHDVAEEEASPSPEAVPAFRELYDTHFGFVWRAAANRGVPEAAMDDVVQEVFLVVHRKLPEFEGRSTVRTWLWGIVRRVVADHLKKRGNQASGQDPLDAHVLQSHEDPALQVEQRAAAALVDALLQKMTDAHREVFVLYELEQLTTREIAELTKTNDNTVQTRLKAARRTFQQALERHRARERRDA
jgi:RNA polymerase sigma-70 factor (ECF subfamily)